MSSTASDKERWYGLHSSYRGAMRSVIVTIVMLVFGVALAMALPSQSETRGIASYLPLHTLLETIAIVIAMLVFAVGWNAYRRGLPGNILLLACAFLGVGLLDFTHMISYPSMPDFVTSSSPEKAINFWLSARSLAAIALLIVAVTPWRSLTSNSSRYLMLAAVLALVGALHWLFLFNNELMPRTFIPGLGLTPFKIYSEYALVALNLFTALTLWMRMRQPLPFKAAGLFGAVCIMALSELLFTLYAEVTDIYNLLGHIYKVISYLFLYRAIFIETIELPYTQLHDTQKQLQATLEALPDLMFELDLEGRYHDYHSPRTDLLAMPAERFLGKTLYEVMPPEVVEIGMSALREANETGYSFGRQIGLTLPTGKHWFELSVSRKPVEAGQLPRFIVLSHDITEPKRVKETLLKSNDLLESIVENSPVHIFWKGLDQRFLGCNTAFAQDAGFSSPADLTGKTDFDMVWKEHAELYRADDKTVMETGRPRLDFEELSTTPDGHTVWLRTSKVPLRDASNQTIGILGIYQDITPHKLAQALRSGQQQVLEKIALGTPLAETLDLLVRVVEAQSHGLLGSILLLDEDGIHVRHGAAPSLPADFNAAVDGQPIGPDAGSCGTAAFRREAVFVEDIATDPLWENYRAAALPHGLRACWSTPIFDAQQQVLGTFAMYYRQPGLPLPEHQQLIDTVTHIAAIAISRQREEILLRNSETRLRNIIDGLGPNMFVGLLSTDGVVLEANHQSLEAAGLIPEDVLGKPVEETYWFGYSENCKRQMREAIARAVQGEASRFDVEIRVSEDQFIPLDFSVHPFRDVNGKVVLLVPSAIVIIERKRAEEALRASEQMYRTIIDSSPVSMAITDDHGNITLLNQKFIETFGYTLADTPTLDKWWPLAYPDPAYRQRVAQEWLAAVEKSQRDNTEIEPMEYTVTCQNGSTRDIRFSMAPMGNFSLVILYDLTELKQAEAELRKLKLAVEQSPNSIVISDLDSNIEYVNDSFIKLTGYSLDEVVGHNPRILQSGKTPKETFVDMWAQLNQGKTWRGELINNRKDGSEYIESVQISPVRQADGRITHYLAIMEDITEAKESKAHIERLAHFDQLTGLPNRSLLADRFSYALSLAQRSDESLTVMFLDLDHFKIINDTLGHTIGDQLLTQIGKRLKQTLRDEDTVSRLGGDEFILILHDTDADGAAFVATKLIQSISQPCQIEQHELVITPSIGIAIYPHDGADFETLSKNADSAMYRVKQSGRNDFRFYTPEMQAHSARTLQLSNALRHALARNELLLHYQPQFSIQGGHIIGAEALLRWHHPELGMISPAEFIPIAEDNGLIIPIGEWVLRTAARQLKKWMEGGLPRMMMAVNLSSVQFRQANITEVVTHILDEVRLPYECLELELTEAVAMDDPQAVIGVMNKLHERGIRMSIDDFGTGYSSLSYLKKFKVYKLKIDQSFVRDISNDPDDKAIVSAIISMASNLGIQTIAEGVETAEQLDYLRQQRCDEVQGYYFSKPLPAAAFEAFVKAS